MNKCCFIFIKYRNVFPPNSIITQKELNLISNWIKPKTSLKYSLLYKASRDGDSSFSFHRKCDYTGKTVTIILTTDGWKFGGFTDATWENTIEDWIDGDHKLTDNTFLFSLNLQKKYYSLYLRSIIMCGLHRGPTFGEGPDIYVVDNCFSNPSTCNSPYTFRSMEINNEFNGGKSEFLVKDIEVYLVENM